MAEPTSGIMGHKPEIGQASAEFEITPAMMEAGVEELWKWEPGWSEPEAAIKRIVEAVLGAQHKAGR